MEYTLHSLNGWVLGEDVMLAALHQKLECFHLLFAGYQTWESTDCYWVLI